MDQGAPRPGLAPGAQQNAGTMFAAIHGELATHKWRDANSESDAYSLFLQRSLAMGWHDGAEMVDTGNGLQCQDVGAGGLWAMNDAGWNHPLVPDEARLVSWFQVEVKKVPCDRPLPVIPFLHCVEGTLDRVGKLRLEAVQLLLPVQGIDPSSRPSYDLIPSMRSLSWFQESDPQARVRVEVSINSGRNPLMTEVAQQLVEHLGHLDQTAFACTSYVGDSPETILSPPFHDSFWNGPPLHGVTLSGELSEWSLDAIGWLSEVVADSSALLGVHSPLLLTAVPSPHISQS